MGSLWTRLCALAAVAALVLSAALPCSTLVDRELAVSDAPLAMWASCFCGCEDLAPTHTGTLVQTPGTTSEVELPEADRAERALARLGIQIAPGFARPAEPPPRLLS